MDRWMVCGDDAQTQEAARRLHEVLPQAQLSVCSSAQDLRVALRGPARGSSVLVAGPCDGVRPINLAAAFAADGCAHEVVLCSADASGSLISRARRAGISRIVRDASELGRGGARAGQAMALPAAPQADWRAAVPSPPASAAAGPAPKLAPVLCFASGRGGVGKTALVAGCACLASSWGMRVGCLDLDLAFGDLFSCFGAEGPADLSELGLLGMPAQALDAGTLARLGKSVAPGVTVWGSCELPEHAELVEPLAGELIRGIASSCDLLLVDTSPAWTDACALAVQVADRLVLVSDDLAGGVASLAKAAALSVRLGVARTRVVRVANRCVRSGDDDDFLLQAHVGLETARSHRVLFEDDVPELLGAGHATELMAGRGSFSGSAGAFLAKTLEELGVLPDDAAASEALAWSERKKRLWPFSREVA